MNRTTPLRAQFFVGLVSLVGLAVLASAMAMWSPGSYGPFAWCLVLAVITARLKLSLPGVDGNLSMNLPFILLAVAKLSFPEAIVIALLSTLAQCMPKNGKRMTPAQVIFNAGHMVNTVGLACLALSTSYRHLATANALALTSAAASFFVVDTVCVAIIIALASKGNPLKLWRSIFVLTFPYFVLGAGVASLLATMSQYVSWTALAGGLVVMYGVYRCYRAYFHVPDSLPHQEVAPEEALQEVSVH